MRREVWARSQRVRPRAHLLQECHTTDAPPERRRAVCSSRTATPAPRVAAGRSAPGCGATARAGCLPRFRPPTRSAACRHSFRLDSSRIIRRCSTSSRSRARPLASFIAMSVSMCAKRTRNPGSSSAIRVRSYSVSKSNGRRTTSPSPGTRGFRHRPFFVIASAAVVQMMPDCIRACLCPITDRANPLLDDEHPDGVVGDAPKILRVDEPAKVFRILPGACVLPTEGRDHTPCLL